MRYEEYAKGLWFDKESNRRLTSEACEVLNDVKEAVRRLLEDIEELKLSKINESEEKHSEIRNLRIICSCECCSIVSAYINSINIIKKHLGWVVGERG